MFHVRSTGPPGQTLSRCVRVNENQEENAPHWKSAPSWVSTTLVSGGTGDQLVSERQQLTEAKIAKQEDIGQGKRGDASIKIMAMNVYAIIHLKTSGYTLH
ncbi:hypothetical protein GPALN_014142 [Globodera pallida]|nr:hypothetical protein GPALN_014142 [Globodera pallida]